MKRILLFSLACLMGLSTISAQKAQDKVEKKGFDEKQRIEQLTQRYIADFGLDEKQAAQFQQIYRDYRKEMGQAFRKYKPQKPVEGEQLSEEDIAKRIELGFEQIRVTTDIREHFYKEFQQVLKPSQIEKIFRDEHHGKMHKPDGKPGEQKCDKAKDGKADKHKGDKDKDGKKKEGKK